MSSTCSILFVGNDHYNLCKTTLQNAIKFAGVKVQLCYFNNGSKDKRMANLANEVCENSVTIQGKKAMVLDNSYCLNQLLPLATGTYICIMPEPLFLTHGWLEALIDHIQNIQDTGIAAIHTRGEKGILTAEVSISDEFIDVWKPRDTPGVGGVMVFHREHLDRIGGFDRNLAKGYEYRQFAWRIQTARFKNYYITGHSAIMSIDPPNQYEMPWMDEKALQNSMNQMIREKNYGISVTKFSPNEEMAYDNIESLRNKIHNEYSEVIKIVISSTFGLLVKSLTSEQLKHIEQFCSVYELKYKIHGSTDFNPNGITILFKSNRPSSTVAQIQQHLSENYKTKTHGSKVHHSGR